MYNVRIPLNVCVTALSFLSLHCQYFSEHHINLINSVNSVSDNFESFSNNDKRDILLYGDTWFNTNKNKFILESTVTYIKTLIGSLDPFLVKFLYSH